MKFINTHDPGWNEVAKAITAVCPSLLSRADYTEDEIALDYLERVINSILADHKAGKRRGMNWDG